LINRLLYKKQSNQYVAVDFDNSIIKVMTTVVSTNSYNMEGERLNTVRGKMQLNIYHWLT